MNVMWIDAGNGAAGDMVLAALLDAGADEVTVREGLARLATEPIGLHAVQVRRHGLRAVHARVETAETAHERHLTEILGLIGAAGFPDPVAEFARSVFTRLAAAEAAVHGVAVEEVHFHEVGALDAIADAVGCALALHSLGVLGAECVVSPVAVGGGSVRSAHGLLPVPAPAVLRLLADAHMPVAAHPARSELCTPTGAALLATLATSFGPLPSCTVRRIGVGAGTRDPRGYANVLRVVLGESRESGESAAAVGETYRVEEMAVVETTIDDLDPRVWPDVLTAMRAAGAADAWCAPVLMHKGRPGHVLTVLAAPSYLDAVCQAIFEQTSTLGLRVHTVQRRALSRDRIVVHYGQTRVGVKRGFLNGRVVTAEPEYEEARRAAEETGRPLRSVLSDVRAAAYRQIGEGDEYHERRPDDPGGPEHRDEQHTDHHG